MLDLSLSPAQAGLICAALRQAEAHDRRGLAKLRVKFGTEARGAAKAEGRIQASRNLRFRIEAWLDSQNTRSGANSVSPVSGEPNQPSGA
jgi:hypothetical protein